MLSRISRRGVLVSVCSPVSDMLRYTACVREWMAADSRNVIAIHCKGGKGLLFYAVSMLYVNSVYSEILNGLDFVQQGGLGRWCARGLSTATSLRVRRYNLVMTVDM